MTGVCSDSFRRFSVYKTSKHAGGLGRERTVKVVVGVDAWAIVHRGAPRSESTVRIASIRPWFPTASSPGWLDSDELLLTLRASTFGAAGLG